MEKIDKILIGTSNTGKYKEICGLLPEKIKKYSLKEFNLFSPEENGESFEENSLIKAAYFSKKTNMICLSDDSGLEIDILNGAPGIYSSRWSGEKNNFDLAIKKIYLEMSKIEKKEETANTAKFVCCLTLYWPDNKSYTSRGIIKGKISSSKKGVNGFGYDPIFIPNGHHKTFGEMEPKLKASIDHRYKAFLQIKNFFN